MIEYYKYKCKLFNDTKKNCYPSDYTIKFKKCPITPNDGCLFGVVIFDWVQYITLKDMLNKDFIKL